MINQAEILFAKFWKTDEVLAWKVSKSMHNGWTVFLAKQLKKFARRISAK